MRRERSLAAEFELDLGRYELRCAGRRVKLERKPMELLIFLVSRRDQMVSRKDIVRRLWQSELLVDTQRNINNIVRKIRTALRDDPARPRFLETVVGKGYRFIGPLRVVEAQYQQGDQTASLPHSREHASLAVIPLHLAGNVTDDQGLCLGFADALISRLGNLHGVDVLPASAVLSISPGTPASEVAPRLGVRFVMTGAMQFSKGQWHVSIEMFDSRRQRVCLARRRDLETARFRDFEHEMAKDVAAMLNRPLRPAAEQSPVRYSRDPLAYSMFMRGYRLSSAGDPASLDQATQELTQTVTRDPGFALAHATLSQVCATRYFEMEPAGVWLEKAEFHCRRALELDADLAEAHVAHAFLLWGPSRNFQHLEAIAGLKRALTLQSNLPHAYNRLGTILAHVGLLDHAQAMYERGSAFHPRKQISRSIVQVYIWRSEYDAARQEIEAWRAESPANKYPIYFAPQAAMMCGNWKEARQRLREAMELLPRDPMVISLQGLLYALTGKSKASLECLAQACASPKSFGHAHHTYYQLACILAVLGQQEAAFEWLEKSVSTGFACWPFFLKDPCLQNLRGLPQFEVLISSLQARYPDYLGIL
ncbi:MAG TPA: winged helix-turn-helix domain-containing protein [Terriglobales bacterium]